MASGESSEVTGAAPTGNLTIRSAASGDVLTVMESMSKATRVVEVLQKLRAERPPPKASVYHLVLGDTRLLRNSTLGDCDVELDGEVQTVSAACTVCEELEAKRQEALSVMEKGSDGFSAALMFQEAMAMQRPPARMMRVCAVVCCLLDIEPADALSCPSSGSGDAMYNFWEPCKDTFTSDVKVWLEKLESFKPELADDIVGNAVAKLAKIQEYIEDPAFNPEEVIKSALAFGPVCSWVLVQVEVLRDLSSM